MDPLAAEEGESTRFLSPSSKRKDLDDVRRDIDGVR